MEWILLSLILFTICAALNNAFKDIKARANNKNNFFYRFPNDVKCFTWYFLCSRDTTLLLLFEYSVFCLTMLWRCQIFSQIILHQFLFVVQPHLHLILYLHLPCDWSITFWNPKCKDFWIGHSQTCWGHIQSFSFPSFHHFFLFYFLSKVFFYFFPFYFIFFLISHPYFFPLWFQSSLTLEK